MGRKQLKDDYAQATAIFNTESSHIKDLQYDPETIMFSFECKGHSVSFTLSIDDPYPVGSMLYPSDGDPREYNVPLALILEDVCKVYCKKFGITYEPKPAAAPVTAPASQQPQPQLQSPPAKAARKLAASFDDDEDESDDDDDTDTFMGEHSERSPRLDEELKAVQAHGYKVSFREYQALDLLDVELHVQSSFIDHRIASAWGLTYGVPIKVRLSVSPSMYDNSATPPKIEVLQSNLRCGLSTQLTQILTTFCAAHWLKFGACVKRDIKLPVPAGASPTPAKNNTANNNNNNNNSKSTKRWFGSKDSLPEGVTEKDVKHLVTMGFERDMATRALAASGGSVEDASHLLLDDESLLLEEEKRKGGGSVPAKRNTDLFSQEQADRELKKYEPTYSEGFLLQLCKYISFRIPTLNKYCVICDGNHLFAGGACLLRPAVCARELCCFAFQALGVMSDAADGIATQAEVVDLLICMAMAAANSARKDLILEPFPTLCDTVDRSLMVLSSAKKDFTLLTQIFSVFPSIEDMMLAQEVTDMKSHLDKAHKYCFPLLQWVINSNRSHIEKIPESRHVKSMNTPHQYVLLSAPPEKEQEFNALKAKHGTVFAFHGSPVENWHCILRTGLRNASGTKLQLNGAAYGAGIYLSPLAATSFGYAARTAYSAQQPAAKKENGRFLGSTNFHCVALCEVINTPSIKKSGQIWVCPEESHVVTRFFFVFPQTQGHVAPNANTETETFLAEVRTALQLQFV